MNHTSPLDLSAALLTAETSGQLPPDAWPALRRLLLTHAEAYAAGADQQAPAQLGAAVWPPRALIAARQALVQARGALDAGYAALARAGDDPAQLANAAGPLAALLAARRILPRAPAPTRGAYVAQF